MARGMMAPKAPAADEQEPAAEASTEAAQPGAEDAEAGGAQQGATDQATPEEQAAYDNFVHMATQIIYAGGRVNQAILDRLALRTPGGDNESVQAITALASVTVAVVSRVQEVIKQAGHKIDATVMYKASGEVMGDLADLAGQKNPKTGKPTHDYTPEEMKGAWLRAVDQYQQAQTASGDLHKEQMQNDWGQIVGAAKAGNLSAISPLLGQAAKQAPAVSGGAPPPPAPAPGGAANG